MSVFSSSTNNVQQICVFKRMSAKTVVDSRTQHTCAVQSPSSFSQDRHSVVKRGEGDSPASTSPEDINQIFKFSPGDGQALQVCWCWVFNTCPLTSEKRAQLCLSFLSADQPTPRYSPTPGARQSQKWWETGGTVWGYFFTPLTQSCQFHLGISALSRSVVGESVITWCATAFHSN